MGRKPQSDADKVAAILAKFNIKTDEPIVVPQADYRHDDAIAVFVDAPASFQANKCLECGKPFAHNQRIKVGSRVGYCSDLCRAENFEKRTGVKFGRIQTGKQPWDGDPPLILKPEHFEWFRQLNDWFTKNRTQIEILPTEPSPEPTGLSPAEELPDIVGPSENQSPIDQGLPEFDFDFASDEDLVFSPESLYLAESQTNRPTSPEPSTYPETSEEDDPFGF